MCAVHEFAGMTAAALTLLREVADEIVVATDSRLPLHQVGPLDDVADVLLRFEFTGPNRFRPWLREQAAGDWLLLLDGDEIPSAALVEALPELIKDRTLAGVRLPMHWPYPDAATRVTGAPFDDEPFMRLVRNDARLFFPGLKHSGAETEPTHRIGDAPILHLALLVHDRTERELKVRAYDEQEFGLPTYDGRQVNEAFYLPELTEPISLAPLPSPDRANVERVLAARFESREPRTPLTVVPGHDVDHWWWGRDWSDDDYRARLVLAGTRPVVARSSTSIRIEVTNLGSAVWPATHAARGAPVALSYHWESVQGSVVVWDGVRSPLPCRVLPGDRVGVLATVEGPPAPGDWILALDLVREGIRWFGTATRVPLAVEESVPSVLASWGSTPIPVPVVRQQRRRLHGRDALTQAMMTPSAAAGEASVHGLPLGGWALDAEALGHILDRVRSGRLRRVLEFGSGVSTVALAACLAEQQGSVLSVEQAEQYAEQTQRLLRERGLDAHARVLPTGLATTRAGGTRTLCYDIDGDIARLIADFAPELVVIDGPSALSGASRLACAPLLVPLCPAGADLVLDDAYRDAELEIGTRWASEPRLQVDGILALGKGLLVGRIRPAAPTRW